MNQRPTKSSLLSTVIDFTVMQFIGITNHLIIKWISPLEKIFPFLFPERQSMPVKPDIKQLCLIKLNHIHGSALSWQMTLVNTEAYSFTVQHQETDTSGRQGGLSEDLVGFWKPKWTSKGTQEELRRTVFYRGHSYFTFSSKCYIVSFCGKHVGKWSQGTIKVTWHFLSFEMASGKKLQ